MAAVSVCPAVRPVSITYNSNGLMVSGETCKS